MLRHQGGEQVKAGFYFNCATWEISTLSGEGGILAGAADTPFMRMPLPLLLVAAPMMGAAFAMFLPFIGIALVLDYAMRQAWAAGRDAMHAAALAISPRTRTGEAYFSGTTDGTDTPADEQAKARLEALARQVDEKEKAGR